MPVAAANLERFLDGTGQPRELPRAEAIKLAPIRDAEATNNERFATKTFRGLTETNDDVRKLAYLRDGEELAFQDKWNRDFGIGDYLWNTAIGDRDFVAAIGRAKFESIGHFKATRSGNQIRITGTVTHALDDEYDFHKWQPGADGARALQKYRGAKPFAFRTEWRQEVAAIIPVNGRRLGTPEVRWGKIAE